MADERTAGSDVFARCAFCPDLCLDRCPVVVATGSIAKSPFGKMMQGYLTTRGVLDAGQAADSFFQCTGCMSCFEACEHDVDVAAALFGMRSRVRRLGVAPYQPELFRQDPDELRRAQRKVVPRRYFVEGARAVLFPGCKALLEAPSVVKDLFTVFDELGIEFVAASDEAAFCCGYPLLAGGLDGEFERTAAEAAQKLRKYRTVVVLSACCAHTIRNLYAQAGVEHLPNVVTAIELIAPLVERTELEPLGVTLAYHDSCFLGRHLGLYDLPRAVIDVVNGLPPVELRDNRADAPCCGAGGAWERTAPDASLQAARNVLAMAHEAGADTLVSAGTSCAAHLAKAANDVEVVDIITLVARWARAGKRR